MLGIPFYRIDQIGDQVGAALILVLDIAQLSLYRLAAGYHIVVGAFEP